MLNQFGLGLAVAVLLDAVVIHCLIVPAVMHLFGRLAWWPNTLSSYSVRVAQRTDRTGTPPRPGRR